MFLDLKVLPIILKPFLANCAVAVPFAGPGNLDLFFINLFYLCFDLIIMKILMNFPIKIALDFVIVIFKSRSVEKLILVKNWSHVFDWYLSLIWFLQVEIYPDILCGGGLCNGNFILRKVFSSIKSFLTLLHHNKKILWMRQEKNSILVIQNSKLF